MSPDGDGHDHADSEAKQPLPAPAKASAVRVVGVVLVVAAIAGGAFAMTYIAKNKENKELVERAGIDERATIKVEVVTPKVLTSERAIALPGSVRPLEETTVYSRANGYVRKWWVDIGDKVKEGQLLAELDTPELDQELVQARAQLAQAEAGVLQAKANKDFSTSSLERYKRLTPQGIASQQELDQKIAQAGVDEASLTVAHAAVGAQHANIERLSKLKSFARVLAPFDGTVVSRTIDRGALVTAGNATPMFKIAATDPVRVYVQVPQGLAGGVRAGIAAVVSVREYPGRKFEGKVARATGALDPMSRTMSTEVRVSNADGALLTGMYAQVALALPSPHRVFELPATALMNDSKGLRVAVVGDDNTIRLVPVVIERDTGSTIEVASGLDGSERVAKLGSAAFSDGTLVEVLKGAPEPAPAPSK